MPFVAVAVATLTMAFLWQQPGQLVLAPWGQKILGIIGSKTTTLVI